MKHQFMTDLLVISVIKFENNRYSVSLPFKENRPILPDNYQLSLTLSCGANQWIGFYMIMASVMKGLNRLKKLKQRLKKTPHLLNEYKIFDKYLKLGIIEEVQAQGDTFTYHIKK